MLSIALRWRHNGRDSFSNHQPHDCLLNRLFRRRSKKTSKLRVTGLYAGNSPVTGEFPHKWPVTRIMLPFDDVIMVYAGHVIRPGWGFLRRDSLIICWLKMCFTEVIHEDLCINCKFGRCHTFSAASTSSKYKVNINLEYKNTSEVIWTKRRS